MSVKTWGDFEVFLDQALGRGGMGAVYRGRQISLDRPAAIKLLKKELTESEEFVKRFHREASLLAKLVDIHVVQVFGAGTAEDSHFYAMEFVEGEDLAVRLKKGHKFGPEEVLRVAESVGRALQAAWRHKIIHRDIKPSNILVTRDGQIKVMDFGLAKSSDLDLTMSDTIMGTAKYMSPEQATGEKLDIRSDLYSLGVVLYELATGKPPFQGDTPTALMYKQVHEQPKPPRELTPTIPMELEVLILRLLAKKPEARYANPDAFLAAVKSVQEGVSPEERSTLYNETILVGSKHGETPAPAPPAKSGSGALVASVLAALVLVGAGGWFGWKRLQETPAPPPPPPIAVQPPPGAPPPAEPVPAPPLPLPAPPSAAWKDALERGLDAYGRREWVAAVTLLEEAAKLGAPDVDSKVRDAKAQELLAKGDAEREDPVKALEHYEAAKRFADTEDVRRRIARASFDRWSRSAKKNEGGDWVQAAADWGRAIPFAEEALQPELQARRKFCETYAEGVRARLAGDWKKALERFRELSKDARDFASSIDIELRRAKDETDKADELARVELKKDLDRLLEEARAAHRRAAWVEARAALERSKDPKYAGFPRESAAAVEAEVAAALAAPPGTVYVPGGTFAMGGGRDVEGPAEGLATTAAYYLDERETTAGDYAEFLKALGEAGHHEKCPKDEPPGKRHVPESWDGQRPEDPVTGVDWWDAASYAAWKGRRLPGEAEWERAASFDPAGRRAYPWGPKFQKEGGKSYLGLSGMGDGVIEWTADWFQKYSWSLASNLDFGQRKKVLRGGVLLAGDAERDARSAHRHWYFPNYRSRKVGFRCAADLKE
jgi:formylglycine-generating enzyme required for sulfatase activity/predicted Ser/Thr protein kinase